MRYALITDNSVVNLIEWDGDTTRWSPPPGSVVVPAPPGVDVGHRYDPASGLFSAPPAVPIHITPITARQIRLALNQAGLRDAVEAAVAAGGRDLRDWWEYSTEVHRDNPMVTAMIQALGVSPEQADDLWRMGAGL